MLERATRKIIVELNGTDHSEKYRFNCSDCKHFRNCETAEVCGHVKYIKEHSPVEVACDLSSPKENFVTVPVRNAVELAKVRTIIERTHRKRMFPYVALSVKIK